MVLLLFSFFFSPLVGGVPNPPGHDFVIPDYPDSLRRGQGRPVVLGPSYGNERRTSECPPSFVREAFLLFRWRGSGHRHHLIPACLLKDTLGAMGREIFFLPVVGISPPQGVPGSAVASSSPPEVIGTPLDASASGHGCTTPPGDLMNGRPLFSGFAFSLSLSLSSISGRELLPTWRRSKV